MKKKDKARSLILKGIALHLKGVSLNKINDYLSYDDGKAEFAAGINQEDGEVVVMYILKQIDTITHIDLFLLS